jgi:exodeoxyribonuclease VII large subunit
MGMLPTTAQRKVFRVSDITREIRTVLEVTFDELWIGGEISNFKRHSSGHIYFTLKDENAAISGAFFRQWNRFLSFAPNDGDAVLIHGRISVYEPRGSYQIIVDRMEPAGEGARKVQLEALKAKLAAEGLFDPDRKRPLPAFPKVIGVATSPTGAVIRDILNVTRRRFPNVHILLAPCRVQGEGADQEIARAIRDLNRDGRPDVLIVGRGGGSMEDLWSFNEEIVCRAIAKSKIPVVSAVGHETDTTLADMVADLRAPTPSAAAELVVQNQAELLARVQEAGVRLAWSIRRELQAYTQTVDMLRERLRDPKQRLQEQAQRIDELNVRIESAMRWTLQRQLREVQTAQLRLRENNPRKALEKKRLQVDRLAASLAGSISVLRTQWRGRLEREVGRLHALSPLGVLGRGYAITFDESGRVLDDAARVQPGDQVSIRLHKGKLKTRVEETWPE